MDKFSTWIHRYLVANAVFIVAASSIISYDNETRSVLDIFRHDAGVLCEIRTLDIEFAALQSTMNETSAKEHDETTVCITSSFENIPQTFKINVSDGLTMTNGNLVWLRGPVRIDQDNASLITSDATEWEIMTPSHHDRHLRAYSNRVTLIVRVTYKGREPSLSAPQLQGRIYGSGPRRVEHSLRSQLKACSQGKYLIRVTSHPDIQGGVLEVSISKSVAGSADSVLTLENLVVATAARHLGDTLWRRLSHVMIVLPQHEDIRFNDDPYYLAYGYLGGTVTVFRNNWAGKLSVCVDLILVTRST